MQTDENNPALNIMKAALRYTPVFGRICVLVGLGAVVAAVLQPTGELESRVRIGLVVGGLLLALYGLACWKCLTKTLAKTLFRDDESNSECTQVSDEEAT